MLSSIRQKTAHCFSSLNRTYEQGLDGPRCVSLNVMRLNVSALVKASSDEIKEAAFVRGSECH